MIGEAPAAAALPAETDTHDTTPRPQSRQVLLAVATVAEALPLLGLHPSVVGMGRRQYRLEGRQAVISAGFAGACQPWLRPGDVLLAGDVGNNARTALGAVAGIVRTIERIASPCQKAALGREGVAAVDMETAWLAAAAAAGGLPFLGVRVIVDRVGDRAVSLASAGHYLRASLRLRQAVQQALRIWP